MRSRERNELEERVIREALKSQISGDPLEDWLWAHS